MTFRSDDDTLTRMKRIVWAVLFLALLPFVAQKSAAQESQITTDPNQQRSALLAKISASEKLPKRVIDAFDAVPRERFLPSYLAGMAYANSSLPVGNGQTLPSPSDLMRAVRALDVQSTDSVLVVGAVTGYTAALLSRLAAHVYDIELIASNRSNLDPLFASLGFTNITVAAGAAADSFSSSAPFDRIFIHGAATDVPNSIFSQLAAGGRMIVPLRDPSGFQMVVGLYRADGAISLETLGKGFYSPIQIGISR